MVPHLLGQIKAVEVSQKTCGSDKGRKLSLLEAFRILEALKVVCLEQAGIRGQYYSEQSSLEASPEPFVPPKTNRLWSAEVKPIDARGGGKFADTFSRLHFISMELNP